MKLSKAMIVGAVAVSTLLVATIESDARPRHLHHAGRDRAPYAGAFDDAPGGLVARRAAAAQKEPGVTSELAPDARQTASGGPVGGVPGFDGY